MTLPTLGRLEPVADLRGIWLNEATSFTPWLARPENLTLLGEAVGIDLEFEAQERNVGPFRADILCKDALNGQWVLVENQLERTDHGHLGQLMTYAAGLQAVTLVWIAARFTDEHRAALDWLNKITDRDFRFFGIEVELWRIGDSPPAPRFNVVAKPNDWTKSVSRAAQQIDEEIAMSVREQQLRYWQRFATVLTTAGSRLRPPPPIANHYMNFRIGRSNFELAAGLNTRERWLRAALWIHRDPSKTYFRQLNMDRVAIEAAADQRISWEELPGKGSSRLSIYLEPADLLDEADWPRQHDWLADTLSRLDSALRLRVKRLEGPPGNLDEPAEA